MIYESENIFRGPKIATQFWGKSVQFTGNRIVNLPEMDTNDYIAMWIRPAIIGARQGLATRWVVGGGNELRLFIDTDGILLIQSYRNNAPGSRLTAAPPLQAGKWHLILWAAYDQFVLDGVSYSLGGSLGYDNPTSSPRAGQAYDRQTGVNRYFTGEVSMIGIIDRLVFAASNMTSPLWNAGRGANMKVWPKAAMFPNLWLDFQSATIPPARGSLTLSHNLDIATLKTRVGTKTI